MPAPAAIAHPVECRAPVLPLFEVDLDELAMVLATARWALAHGETAAAAGLVRLITRRLAAAGYPIPVA